MTKKGFARWVAKAHPFFWCALVGLAVAAVVAACVGTANASPSWALESEAVRRFEIGLVVYLAVYLVALALCLAYAGRSFGRVDFPGGGGIDTKDPDLAAAAEGADTFQEDARQNFTELADAVDTLNAQVTALEDRRLGERLAVLEDRRGPASPAREDVA